MSTSNGNRPEPVGSVFRIQPRWTDLDPAGHVNNSVYLVYAEEARNPFLRTVVPEAWNSVVVVHNAIDYHHSVEQMDVVEVSSVVEHVGNSSLTTVSSIATAQRLCATVRTVQVVLREDRSGSRPWTDSERAALNSQIVKSTEHIAPSKGVTNAS